MGGIHSHAKWANDVVKFWILCLQFANYTSLDGTFLYCCSFFQLKKFFLISQIIAVTNYHYTDMYYITDFSQIWKEHAAIRIHYRQ